MSAAVSVPHHTLKESPSSRTIEIYDWEITARTNPISNANELDALQSAVGGMPLPEMTFGNNSLELHHKPSGWKYSFNTEDALKGVKNGELEEGDGGVRVGYADAWLKSRNVLEVRASTGQSSQLPMPKTVPTKPYDWTYTTTYPGRDSPTSSGPVYWRPADTSKPEEGIPLAELTRQDPILFYAEIPLYEDELHDNGSSHLLVRIRVMPTCIFILSRFTLRVDNVLFRTYDTRIYHSFSSSPPLVVRERSGWEAPYDWVKRRLPKRDDLTPLTDPTYIAKVLTDMPTEVTQQAGAGTKWRGLGIQTDIAILQ
ncbi:type 2A phosphatase activator TIP41 [Wolfiporia cocos MD-104 SS10]|uniref:Type 2A phosphatase activator TIP41 n=1 Tax=Wolfiporia cocos (strain MD-104) TaxID=742152 RepID=A0A2H3JLU1_WOLCO|nr:type 2A phosphatase activator TIP41 [Wolfiporia cocos MD-104 SS10]